MNIEFWTKTVLATLGTFAVLVAATKLVSKRN